MLLPTLQVFDYLLSDVPIANRSLVILFYKVSKILCIFTVFFMPVIISYKAQFSKTTRFSAAQLFVIGVGLIWVFIQISVYFTNGYLDAKLYAHDLNGDGVFTGNEINEAQRHAMQRVTSDTGRALAPFTGIIFAFIYMWILNTMFVLVKALMED